MTVEVRAATPDDLDGIMRLEPLLFGADAWLPATFLAELSKESATYLVAIDGDVVVGYAGASVIGWDADIQTIGVAPSHQRQGIARTLLSTILDDIREQGVVKVFLEVRSDNDGARRLYDDLGFEGISVRRGYYSGGKDAVVMRLRLGASGARLGEESAR